MQNFYKILAKADKELEAVIAEELKIKDPEPMDAKAILDESESVPISG